MGRLRRRRRFWLELGLAIAAFSLLVLTIAAPDWIEIAFGVEPDAGEGWTEALVAAGLGVVFLVSISTAVLEFARRNRAADRLAFGRVDQ